MTFMQRVKLRALKRAEKRIRNRIAAGDKRARQRGLSTQEIVQQSGRRTLMAKLAKVRALIVKLGGGRTPAAAPTPRGLRPLGAKWAPDRRTRPPAQALPGRTESQIDNMINGGEGATPPATTEVPPDAESATEDLVEGLEGAMGALDGDGTGAMGALGSGLISNAALEGLLGDALGADDEESGAEAEVEAAAEDGEAEVEAAAESADAEAEAEAEAAAPPVKPVPVKKPAPSRRPPTPATLRRAPRRATPPRPSVHLARIPAKARAAYLAKLPPLERARTVAMFKKIDAARAKRGAPALPTRLRIAPSRLTSVRATRPATPTTPAAPPPPAATGSRLGKVVRIGLVVVGVGVLGLLLLGGSEET